MCNKELRGGSREWGRRSGSRKQEKEEGGIETEIFFLQQKEGRVVYKEPFSPLLRFFEAREEGGREVDARRLSGNCSHF